jgi:DNA-binding transcriptional MerR regulator
MDGQGQQQGGGQQGDGGGQGDGGQGQQQGGQQQGQQTPDANAIARAARLEGEGTGYANAAKELGVSIEEAKTILADAKKRSDAEKTAEQKLTDREADLNTANETTKAEKKRADRYEKIVKANVDAQLQNIDDEAITELLSNFDVAGQFEWLTKHGAKYVGTPTGDAGDGGGQQDGGQQRRAPDASGQQGKIPGLDESSQAFNDILRQRGLSSGVS